MSFSNGDSSKTISKITGEPLKKRGRKSKKDLLENEKNKENANTNKKDNIIISIEENMNHNKTHIQPEIVKHIMDNNEEINENDNDNENVNNENANENDNDNEKDNENENDNGPNTFIDELLDTSKDQKPAIKKRGRKPKGGKIIQQAISLNDNKDVKPNIILHLKCSVNDIYKNKLTQSLDSQDIISYNEFSYDSICKIDTNVNNQMNIQNISYKNEKYSNEEENFNTCENDNYSSDNTNNSKSSCSIIDTKDIYKKLKNLEHNLHINNINDKKSACFWCTCDFDNPPIYIPKHFIKDTYEVYGCFCSPECATAYLMDENIDSSDKFERYHLINYIYTKIYDYKKNIKPAPNPYYILDKYYGNLTIQEYRSLLRSERLFLVVDKPLTRILPELHEDNDDFIINNKIIPSNTFQVKKKLQKKMTKNNIVNEKFGISSQ
jgi:hypothetical protein